MDESDQLGSTKAGRLQDLLCGKSYRKKGLQNVTDEGRADDGKKTRGSVGSRNADPPPCSTESGRRLDLGEASPSRLGVLQMPKPARCAGCIVLVSYYSSRLTT